MAAPTLPISTKATAETKASFARFRGSMSGAHSLGSTSAFILQGENYSTANAARRNRLQPFASILSRIFGIIVYSFHLRRAFSAGAQTLFISTQNRNTWARGKGGLPLRSNCKGPQGPPCAVTPNGTEPPSTWVFSRAQHNLLTANCHPVKPVANSFLSPPIGSRLPRNGSQIALSPEFARNSGIRGNSNHLVPVSVKLYGRQK